MNKPAKILFGVLGAIVVIGALGPLVIPAHQHVERSIEINAPVTRTYALLSDFSQFDRWNPFRQEDPGSKTQAQGAGVGSVYSWQGEKSGEGKMIITALEANQVVKMDLDFIKPMPAKATSDWRVESTATGSRVTWLFDQEMSYSSRWFGLMMDKMMGGLFEKGLSNLKNTLETQ